MVVLVDREAAAVLSIPAAMVERVALVKVLRAELELEIAPLEVSSFLVAAVVQVEVGCPVVD
jgi:hypothetical protein